MEFITHHCDFANECKNVLSWQIITKLKIPYDDSYRVATAYNAVLRYTGAGQI